MLRSNVLFLFCGDIAVFVAGLFLALVVRNQGLPDRALFEAHLNAFVGIFILWVVVFLIAGLYDTTVALTRKRIPAIIIRAQFINLSLAVIAFFILPVGLTPKVTLALYLAITTPLIVAWRLFVFPFFAARKVERALIVGGGEEARSLAAIMNEGAFFKFVTAITIDPKSFATDQDFMDAIRTRIADESITMVVGDMHGEHANMLVPVYYKLAFLHRHVTFLSLHQLYEQIFHRIPPSLIRESWILENVSHTPHFFDDLLKRAFDIGGALFLGILSLPFYPLIMLLIKTEDSGPIFYRTERIGRYNSHIRILKFRTMTGTDSGDDALSSTLRITRVGRFLRKTRLDEIPQFWNILRGDLSFIGPRPEMPALANVYAEGIRFYDMRHMIKPGLSGWAQINEYEVPRNGVDVDRTITKLSFDLYYLKHRSFLLDLEIALKTIKTLLVRSGT